MRYAIFAAVVVLVVTVLVQGDLRAAQSVEGRPGVQQLFLFTAVPNPVASVILFPGGNGRAGIESVETEDTRSRNFLARSRTHFATQGFNVAFVDVPSDRRSPNGLSGFRATDDHARDIAAVAQVLREKVNVPVFAVGTSRGSISAANAAARLSADLIAGAVLTSTVTRPSRNNQDSVMDVDLQAIRTPVLVVYHEQDGCSVSRPVDVPSLTTRLRGTDMTTISIQGGGPNEADVCEALTYHGYLRREAETVGKIGDWIKSKLR